MSILTKQNIEWKCTPDGLATWASRKQKMDTQSYEGRENKLMKLTILHLHKVHQGMPGGGW